MSKLNQILLVLFIVSASTSLIAALYVAIMSTPYAISVRSAPQIGSQVGGAIVYATTRPASPVH